MMKKNLLWIGSLIWMGSAFALSQDDIPNSFFIKTQSDCIQCKTLTTDDGYLGQLKLAPNKRGTFYYFDNQNQLQNTFILKAWTAGRREFDILDQYQNIIAYLNVYAVHSAAVSGLALLATDKKTRLFYAAPGLFSFGKLTFGVENHTVGDIVRDSFDLNSEINITDKPGFLAIAHKIDINVLYAVLAFNYMPVITLDVDK